MDCRYIRFLNQNLAPEQFKVRQGLPFFGRACCPGHNHGRGVPPGVRRCQVLATPLFSAEMLKVKRQEQQVFDRLVLSLLYKQPPPLWKHPDFLGHFGDPFVAATPLEGGSLQVRPCRTRVLLSLLPTVPSPGSGRHGEEDCLPQRGAEMPRRGAGAVQVCLPVFNMALKYLLSAPSCLVPIPEAHRSLLSLAAEASVIAPLNPLACGRHVRLPHRRNPGVFLWVCLCWGGCGRRAEL
jgi:hypothetical protein